MNWSVMLWRCRQSVGCLVGDSGLAKTTRRMQCDEINVCSEGTIFRKREQNSSAQPVRWNLIHNLNSSSHAAICTVK